jgi:hypothetical protein
MWPFKRKPTPLNPGPINEDWKAGDLAECIVGGTAGHAWLGQDGDVYDGPERGDVLSVVGVYAGSGLSGDGWFLDLKGLKNGFAARCFRKVPPLNSEADAEFTARIKRLKPSTVRV